MASGDERRAAETRAAPDKAHNEAGSISQRFLSRLYRATRAVNAVLGGELEEEYGLELRDFMVLSSIVRGHRYPSAIARQLHANKFAVSRVLQKLAELGLVDRQIDGDDSRRVLLNATKAGNDLRERALADMRRRLEPLLQELGDERAETLVAGLEAVGDFLADDGGAR